MLAALVPTLVTCTAFIGLSLVLRLVERRCPLMASAPPGSTHLLVLVLIGVGSTLIANAVMDAAQAPIVSLFNTIQLVSVTHWPLPAWLTVLIGFLICDLLNYGFHVLSHKLPLLWQFHKLHHVDTHLSSFTGILHHPMEGIIGAAFALAGYVLLGLPVISVLAYTVVSWIFAAVSHANIRLPAPVDKYLGPWIVLPRHHFVHHSSDPREGHRNFASVFAFWDRLFGTRLLVSDRRWRSLAFGVIAQGSTQPVGIVSALVPSCTTSSASPRRTKK